MPGNGESMSCDTSELEHFLPPLIVVVGLVPFVFGMVLMIEPFLSSKLAQNFKAIPERAHRTDGSALSNDFFQQHDFRNSCHGSRNSHLTTTKIRF
jgi:uncharacterized protein YjeT (DUF2065 family)